MCVNSGAKVSLVPVEGRPYAGDTTSKGKVVIKFPGSRSFIIEVTNGPEHHAATSRMYGEMDHNVSVYMGPSPVYAYEDVLGIQGEASPDEMFSLCHALRIFWSAGRIDGELEMVDADGRALPLAIAMLDRETPSDAPLLDRGEIAKPKDSVPRGFPEVIELADVPPPPSDGCGRRPLAQWLTHADRPLTARGMANRAGTANHDYPNGAGNLGLDPSRFQRFTVTPIFDATFRQSVALWRDGRYATSVNSRSCPGCLVPQTPALSVGI